jgi:hypothetical protein
MNKNHLPKIKFLSPSLVLILLGVSEDRKSSDKKIDSKEDNVLNLPA